MARVWYTAGSVYAERFHRRYSGQPALLNRRYRGTTTVSAYLEVSHRSSSSILYGSHGGTVQQQPHFELVPLLQLPAKLACACVCAVCLVILDLRNKRVATGFALGIPRTPRRTMETHNSYEFQKKPRSYSSKMHTVQLQRYNSSRA